MGEILKYSPPTSDYDGPTLEFVQKKEDPIPMKGTGAIVLREIGKTLAVVCVIMVFGGLMLTFAMTGIWLVEFLWEDPRATGTGYIGGSVAFIIVLVTTFNILN